MAYEIDEIRSSQEIFYYLLKHRELKESDDRQLYRQYVENENVQALVKSAGEVSETRIERFGDSVYMIPAEGNSYLGFTKTQLKSILCRSGATDRDYYLSQFVVLTLLMEFYDGQGASSKTRDFIRMGDLQNRVSERLSEGVREFDEEDEDRAGIAFSDMLEAFEALRSDENGRRTKTTKEGFLYNIILFLQKQGLVDYVERDETILTTKKLDQFMDYDILNENNYVRVERILKGIEGARASENISAEGNEGNGKDK